MQRDQLLAGRYRLLERLGSGGMAVVHRAYDEVLERDVAVKVLVASEVNARQRIRGEAKAAARLAHPHVTSVYDYGESLLDGAEVPFVVMELLNGHTLEQRLAAGPLPPRAALRVCAEVASALAAAHDQGLVHRDIKPANVMLTPTGAKVLDFGIAAGAGEPEIDFEGRLLGTPAYLAPERLRAGEVLPASDVYALGLLLYRVLTGRLPWPAEGPIELLRADRPVEPDLLPPIDGVPPEVHRLYRWCLARDPADRPSACAAARTLRAVISGVEPEAVIAPPAAVAASEAASATPGATETKAAGATESKAGATEKSADGATESKAAGATEKKAGPATEKSAAGATEEKAAGATGDAPGRPVLGAVGRHGSWRRRRAILTVGGAVIAALALAGSLGDFANRRPERGVPPTAGGPGTTTVGMPQPGESVDSVYSGPSAIPPPGTTAPAVRTSPPTSPDASEQPPPTATIDNPTPTGATPAPTPTPGSDTPVVALGGTVTVRCTDRSIEVLAVTLAPGFRVEAYDPGPAKQIQVELISDEHRSEIRAHCANGRPKPKVKEGAA
ncbi:protein kinase [Micromonospora sp. WMMD1120]|uniref:serine/threonine-protein kinase n=1 Tax=Micromonospora sp. WMMD1120 TaxID=3016106 RepID=UPI0024161F00|nr:protein kinase [Micromonospora sp. WMMD1120]MDG4806549.1 protein kinase [Micromonospora sp. WMMD1120]